jgi:hypothetical protein
MPADKKIIISNTVIMTTVLPKVTLAHVARLILSDLNSRESNVNVIKAGFQT